PLRVIEESYKHGRQLGIPRTGALGQTSNHRRGAGADLSTLVRAEPGEIDFDQLRAERVGIQHRIASLGHLAIYHFPDDVRCHNTYTRVRVLERRQQVNRLPERETDYRRFDGLQ